MDGLRWKTLVSRCRAAPRMRRRSSAACRPSVGRLRFISRIIIRLFLRAPLEALPPDADPIPTCCSVRLNHVKESFGWFDHEHGRKLRSGVSDRLWSPARIDTLRINHWDREWLVWDRPNVPVIVETGLGVRLPMLWGRAGWPEQPFIIVVLEPRPGCAGESLRTDQNGP